MTNALITGANKGIGFEIARELQERGVTVLIGARDEERGRVAAEKLGARSVRLDVTSEDSVKAAAAFVEEEYGSLDILVNNAGIIVHQDDHLPSGTPLEMMRATYETNVFGVVAVTNAMLPLLRRAPAARIVNMSSGLGSLTLGSDPSVPFYDLNLLTYNSSKAALNMVTLSYAKELRDTPIKVNAADPGYCATDMNDHTGYRTATQGAAIAVRLALLPEDGPTGAYMDDEGVVPW
ncbi:SDR family oxidoreductase [Sphaerisporangium aureirubrum]|uniref:SDR family oxidoreductase n=1 Tax=Sphaerisporangium aureirubrum TaxID=1544736 RepID=A0ABW1NGN6_9ACTN